MNDEQVKAQINQLVSFIRQEAQDKASEIRAKAEEDFNIRKLSAVQKEREKIRAEHEKRTKAIEINRKIAQSTQLNEARLEVLGVRDNILQETLKETSAKLSALKDDPAGYSELVSNLILQGLLLLKDKQVVIRCRRADVEIVDTCLESVKEKYLAKMNEAVEVVTDKKTFLDDSITGGVILLSQGNSIVVDNTFESRLEIAYSQNLPEIRSMLFASA